MRKNPSHSCPDGGCIEKGETLLKNIQRGDKPCKEESEIKIRQQSGSSVKRTKKFTVKQGAKS